MMPFYDILRSLVTNAMLVTLLFTLARPKFHKYTLWTAFGVIVTLDAVLNDFFYLRGDYTTLAIMDIVFFVIVGFAVKPLFRDTFMQWLFNLFTVMNVYAVTVVVSYYLCGIYWNPYYAITALRLLLFSAVILLFRKKVRPLYRQAVEHWSVYLFVAAGLFANFSWYFFSSSDIEQTLIDNFTPLILLVLLTVLIYCTIFFSLSKALRETALIEENLKILSDRELTIARLSMMDETVRQMSIVQHDRRHVNNTLLSLLQQGETDKAAELIAKQSETLPKKPQSYCQNISINAAVSYYVELAHQQGITCDMRLNISKELQIDELSFAMAVSNLMENAINAVSVLPAPLREIHFTAVSTGQLILEISNPYNGEIKFNENGLPKSKADGHGKGGQSVANFVKRYDGDLNYEINDGKFTVRIMI